MIAKRKINFLETTTNENYQIDGVNIFDGFDTEKHVKFEILLMEKIIKQIYMKLSAKHANLKLL